MSVTCPLCRYPSAMFLTAWDRNFEIGHEEFSYGRCERCGIVSISDVPQDLNRYYPEAYYPLLTGPAVAAAAAHDQHKLEFLPPASPGARLVEVGPGRAAFAAAARTSGYDVTVVEMGERNVAHLRDVLAFETIESSEPDRVLDDLTPVQVIAAWHVLEHLPHPWSFVRAAAGALASNGVLVLATPNPDAFGFKLLGARWPHLDAPRHLSLTPARTLVGFLAGCGLRCTRLTSNDQDGRHWNRFAWKHALAPPIRGDMRGPGLAGEALARLAAPIEERGLRGATYTAVFEKL